MAINFGGNVYDDAGNAVSGASVKLLETGTTTQEGSTVTTDSDGRWDFSEADQDRYDVEITKGSSVRRIKWSDEISLQEIDVRNNTGATTPAATFSNITNSTANQVAVFSGANSTKADNDEIYLSFKLHDSAGNLDEFARMTVVATDVTSGSEDGQFEFDVLQGGSLIKAFTIASSTAGAQSIDFNQDSVTFGTGTAATDITLTFDAESADGVITWMEDEDYFKFSDEILMNGTEKILFGDTATFIHQSSDGVMTVDGEATIDLNASTAVLVSNDLKLNSDSAVLGFGADNDTTLTHTDGTGLTLNSTNKLTFGDTGTFIHQSSDGVLTITSDTTVDINGAVVFDGAITGATAITSGTIDATTDFTIGDTVITDGVITDSSGLQLAANLDIDGTADISGDLTLSGGADGALQFTNAGENSIKIPDNQASALIIEEANNAYITFVTTNSSEAITVAKATTFSAGIADAGTIAAGTWNGTDVGVAYGGTGASSLTDGGVLLGSGTSAVTAMAVLADGEMIVGDGTTDPVAESGATLRTSIGVGTGNAVEFAGITGTTIDATTDFTIGDTVVTDGTITDSSGLTIAAAVDLGSNTLTSTGSMQIRTIDYSDGDVAMTIADGGGVTFAQTITMNGQKNIVNAADDQYIRYEGGTSTSKGGQFVAFGHDFDAGGAGMKGAVQLRTTDASSPSETTRLSIAGNDDDATLALTAIDKMTFDQAVSIEAGGNTITLDENVKIHDGDLYLDNASGQIQVQFQNAGTYKYIMGMAVSSDQWFLNSSDIDGAGTGKDLIRIPHGQATVDFDSTTDESAFDDYDDAMVLAAAYSPTAESYKLGKDIMARGKELLAEIGILRKYDDGWLGYSPQRMDALMAGAIYQSRTTIDILSGKVKELEAQVLSLKGEN